MGKRGSSSSFQNAFAALAVDAADPDPLLSVPSRREQKRAEHQARKVLLEVGGGWPPVQHKPKRKQQQQRGSSSRASLDSTDSLQAALEAIAAAEQQQQHQHLQQQHESWPQQQEAWPQHQEAWPEQQQGLDSDGDEDAQQLLLGSAATSSTTAAPAGSYESDPWAPLASVSSPSPPAAAAAGWPGQQQPQHQQDAVSGTTALCWQRFALSFAAAARDCGDEDAADTAVQFGLSTTVDLAAIAADDAALLELGGIADEAAAAGVSVEELLEAQQAELLLQANASSRHKTSWRQVQVDWAGSAGSTSPVQQQQQQCSSQPPAVHCPESFPSLEAPAAAAGSHGGWQTVGGRSPLSVSRHWRGGRAAPKAAAASGIKLVRTADAAGGASSSQRPQQHPLERHWDLVLDGLVLKERGSLDDAGGPATAADFHDGDDPWEAVLAAEAAQAAAGGDDRLWRRYAEEAAAAQRTRDLLTRQEAAAAATAAAGGGASSNNRLGQDRVRRMMVSAAAAKRSGNDDERASSCGSEDAAADTEGCCEQLQQQPQQRQQEGGAKNLYGYSWPKVFKAALAGGWVPVNKLDGGGGSHFKLRRVLPVSGQTQTVMLACTPSDTARGPRNAAASLLRKDEERERLEAQAAAAAKQTTAPAAAVVAPAAAAAGAASAAASSGRSDDD